jgi:hypothetical protein
MSYSIMDMGQSTKSQATGSLNTLADMEQNREIANDQIDAQKKQAQMSGVASGAMIGFSVGGPVGAAIGGSVGFLAGSL